MAQRDRTRSTTINGGKRWQSGALVTPVNITNSSETFTDFTDPGDCRPINGASWRFSGGLVDYPLSVTGTGFESYVCDMLRSTVAGPHIGNVQGVPGDIAAATSAAARTNPSRPYVDVPVEVLQIGEIFKLIQKRGASLIKELGRENLRYQFGIKPVVDDVFKMFHFHEQADRRVQEIKRLQTQKGLRKTVVAGQSSLASDVLWTQQSNGLFLSTRARGNTVFTKKVHCRWLPIGDLSKMYTPAQMSALIQRCVLGLTVDFSTVWELIPWSWLIDWGTNVGTFLQASRNIIPAQLTTCVVMLHTRTEWSSPGLTGVSNNNRYKLQPIQIIREGKTRTSVSPSVTAQFPFLSGNQLGILASLAVTRA
jgi:hypothetical protein|uniref:Uncharacterized protein n=1 Tax=Leviviridae sp. TaxID=2027243 RepID=A0A514DA87_9VIRU|nr:MAG: hypothetical protein H1BulkLitter5855_000003 [Leviviridae sp.]